jgi:hypothetical protein
MVSILRNSIPVNLIISHVPLLAVDKVELMPRENGRSLAHYFLYDLKTLNLFETPASLMLSRQGSLLVYLLMQRLHVKTVATPAQILSRRKLQYIFDTFIAGLLLL